MMLRRRAMKRNNFCSKKERGRRRAQWRSSKSLKATFERVLVMETGLGLYGGPIKV